MRPQIVALSWTGLAVLQAADDLGCHARTVRSWIHRFNAEDERSRIVAWVKTVPPGRLRHDPAAEGLVQADETSTAAVWTLDALVQAAKALGIAVSRSHVRRILLADGARWRHQSVVKEPRPAGLVAS
ncbi:helix-turn-helix domain-containing protein [Krasilnikovia sp. MM14-A1259]|uniref:helix-turn-helix domain-containing protein n=1 Tax=Krasilnikovia sp. MM14-A1259 TaxID=3373539 RepID=UPI00382FE5E8